MRMFAAAMLLAGTVQADILQWEAPANADPAWTYNVYLDGALAVNTPNLLYDIGPITTPGQAYEAWVRTTDGTAESADSNHLQFVASSAPVVIRQPAPVLNFNIIIQPPEAP